MSKDKTQVLLENKDVFEETLNEFSFKGYELASVNEIIKRSQFNKGSFYYRFKDKYELYISLLDFVFVQQVDLYKKTGFSLISNQHINDIISSMFTNLVDLYQLDRRYYDLLMRLLNEEEEFIQKVSSDSVGSLYERYIVKLKQSSDFGIEKTILLKSLYKNFPINQILDGKIKVSDLVLSLLGNTSENNQDLSVSSFEESLEMEIDDYISFIIIGKDSTKLSDQWFDIVSASKSEKSLVKHLKRKSFGFGFDIKTLLNKYIHKPIFNHLALHQLISEGLDKVVLDEILRPLLYAYVYAIIDLRPLAYFNQLFEYLSHDQIDLFVKYILPINGRLTKTVIFDNKLSYRDDYALDSFYYFDEFLGFRKFHISDFKGKYDLTYYCEYIYHHEFLHKYFSSYKDFVRFTSENEIEILELKLVHELSIEELREVHS